MKCIDFSAIRLLNIESYLDPELKSESYHLFVAINQLPQLSPEHWFHPISPLHPVNLSHLFCRTSKKRSALPWDKNFYFDFKLSESLSTGFIISSYPLPHSSPFSLSKSYNPNSNNSELPSPHPFIFNPPPENERSKLNKQHNCYTTHNHMTQKPPPLLLLTHSIPTYRHHYKETQRRQLRLIRYK